MTHETGCGDWSRQTFWGDEPLDASFWKVLTMPGLLSVLGAGRILVLRQAHLLPVKSLSDMEPLLRRANPDLWVFFCLEGEWKGKTPAIPATVAKQPYFKAAKTKGWLWESPGFTEQSLQKFVQAWARKQGIGFARGVEARLLSILPLDGAQVRNELEKLELLLNERTQVTAADLELLGEQSALNSFAFLTAVLSSSADLSVWRTIFKDQTSTGAGMLMPFLGLLQRELRILWQLATGEEHKVALPPFVKREKKPLAAQLGEQGLARIWDLVFQAELDLKTGRKQADQILEFLAANLSGR